VDAEENCNLKWLWLVGMFCNHKMHKLWSVDSRRKYGIKIVATRCQILRLKCTKSFVGGVSASDTAGGAYSYPPDLIAGF